MARRTFRRVIVTLEKLEKVNPENIKLMNGFLREKNTRCSNLTVESYRSDLNIFWVWNLENNDNKFFVDIRKIEFADFFSYCVEELHWGSGKFSRERSTISSFSQYIEKFHDDRFPHFRCTVLKAVESMPKVEAREKTVLSEKQINDLLKYLSKEDAGKACWFALAIASGARFSELLRFTTDILDPNHTCFNGVFMETTQKIKTKGRTKVGKLLNKYIIKDIFLPYYEKWLIERKEILDKNNKNHNFLFIKKNGDPAVSGTIRSWLPEMEKFLGVPFYVHAARHAWTTYLSKKGLPTQLIQEIGGWSDSSMVSLYDDLQAKDKVWTQLDNLLPKNGNSGVIS